MKIQIQNEDELIKTAEEAIKILSNLRKFTKLWEESYGVELKRRKKSWEAAADKFIDGLQMKELKSKEEVKIELK